MYVLEREPTTPGEILSEEFLKPLAITQRRLAEHIGCEVKVINRIVNGRSSIGAELAMRLAGALDTSPEFWLNAQQAVDVHAARHRVKELPKSPGGPLTAGGPAMRESPPSAGRAVQAPPSVRWPYTVVARVSQLREWPGTSRLPPPRTVSVSRAIVGCSGLGMPASVIIDAK